MSRSHILKDSALYGSATLFQQLCAMVSGFFVARLLGPQIQGVWQTARLFATYSDLSSLGHGFGMRRQAAVAIGAGRTEEAADQRDTGFVWSTATMLAAAVIVAGLNLFVVQDPMLSRGLSGIALALVFIGPSTFFNFWFKTIDQFGALSAAAVAGGLASLATIPLIYWKGFDGAIAGFVLMHAAALAVQAVWYKNGYRIRFVGKAFRDSLAIGLPLWTIMVLGMLFTTVDRLVVVSHLGFADMGFYSISTMFFLPLETAVASLAVVLLPRACRQFGATASFASLGKFFVLPLSVVLTGLPFAAGIGALLLPLVIDLLLPNYTAGILPAQILLFGLSFSCAAGFCNNIIVAAGKPWWLLVETIVSFAFKLALLLVLVKRGMGLPGIAAASSAALLLRFVIQYVLSVRITGSGRKSAMIILLGFIAAAGCSTGVWLADSNLSPLTCSAITRNSLGLLVMFVTSMLPALWFTKILLRPPR